MMRLALDVSRKTVRGSARISMDEPIWGGGWLCFRAAREFRAAKPVAQLSSRLSSCLGVRVPFGHVRGPLPGTRDEVSGGRIALAANLPSLGTDLPALMLGSLEEADRSSLAPLASQLAR